jgi:hypothetical protein
MCKINTISLAKCAIVYYFCFVNRNEAIDLKICKMKKQIENTAKLAIMANELSKLNKYNNSVFLYKIERGYKSYVIEQSKIIIAKRAERAANANNKATIEQVIINNKLEMIAKAMPSMGYSMGAIMTVSIYKSKYSASYSTCREYRGRRYSATHGYFNLVLSAKEFSKIEVIGGLITIRTKKNKCLVLKSEGYKQHYSTKWVEMFICGDFHANTLEHAKEMNARNIENKKTAIKNEKLRNKAIKMTYTYVKAVAAGNCEVGIMNFVRNAKLDPYKKYSGKKLLELAEKFNVKSNINRMIEYRMKQLAS